MCSSQIPAFAGAADSVHHHSKSSSLVGDQMLPGKEPKCPSLLQQVLSADEGPEDPHFIQDRQVLSAWNHTACVTNG